MAKTPARAMDLMMRVWPAAVAAGRGRVADMQPFARAAGVQTIEPWDYRYYQEKVRKAKYDLTQEEMKPYFELDNIIQGMFYGAGQLYGLDFKEITGTVPVFHPDVRIFEVTDRRRQAGRPVLPRRFRPRRQAVGRLDDDLSPPSGLTRRQDSCSGRNNNNFAKPRPASRC